MSEPVTRKEMRHRTKSILADAGFCDGNVTASRRRPVAADGGSCAIVYSPFEGMNSPGPEESIPHFDTIIRVAVEIFAQAPASANEDEDDEEALDDLLDELIDEARETLLCSAEWLAGVAGVASVEIEKQPEIEGQIFVSGARLTFQLALGESYWQPDLDTPLLKIAGRVIVDESGEGDPVTKDYGLDLDGDGKADVEFEHEISTDTSED